MIERREDLRFAREAREAIGIVRDRRQQDFDRHIAIQLRIAGPIHLPHATRAKCGEDLIRAEPCAGGQGQG